MIDHFKDKFIVEAQELIENLEENLLAIEKNPNDSENIQGIFRAVHTLKGSGAMFGMQALSGFAHNFEDLFDRIRNGEMVVNEEIVNLCFKAVDHFNVLIQDKYDEDIIAEGELIISNVEKLLSENKDGISNRKVKTISSNQIKSSKGHASYYIYFKPDKNILRDGTKPLFLIEELASLGVTYIICSTKNIPDLFLLNPVLCYVEWEILLFTDEEEDVINEVFIFVEDDAELIIEKVSENNIIEYDDVINYIDSRKKNNELADVDTLKNIISSVSINKKTETFEVALDKNIPERENESIVGDANISDKTEKKQHKIKEAVSIRVDSNKIDELINIVSELVTVQARLNLLSENSVDSELKDVSEAIEKITRNLRNNAFEISLVAIKSIKIRFSRLVRDLSMELNKNIVFETKGDETELDKSIVEKLTDPLLHIFRNCIDHGIESEKERLAAGKPAVGTILMNSYYSGSEVHIRIQDDGRGIDPDKIKQKAIDKAVIAKNTDLSKHQIFDLLFIPGFSTAKTVSDVSGRGVGMDVVKKKVSQLRGVVDIDSELGKGTSITIKLPLTLSIIDGLLVSIDNIHYILPMSYVDKIYPVTKKAINESYNNIIVFDGEQIPFLYLRDEFGYPDNCSEFQQAVVVIYEKKKIALIVDNVDREFQAVIKSLGEHYKNQQYFSGASILGDGSIALILDTNKIIEEFTS